MSENPSPIEQHSNQVRPAEPLLYATSMESHAFRLMCGVIASLAAWPLLRDASQLLRVIGEMSRGNPLNMGFRGQNVPTNIHFALMVARIGVSLLLLYVSLRAASGKSPKFLPALCLSLALLTVLMGSMIVLSIWDEMGQTLTGRIAVVQQILVPSMIETVGPAVAPAVAAVALRRSRGALWT